jgi:hypothetical protein
MMMAQAGGNKCVDLCKCRVRPSRPSDIHLRARAGHRIAPVIQECVPDDDGTSPLPRLGLGVEHMPEPQKTSISETQSVSTLKRASDLKRRSQRQEDARGPRDALKHRKPKWHQPAHAGIFDDGKTRITELVHQYQFGVSVHRFSLRTAVPVRIDAAPVLPIASGEFQNVIVE